jgi:hypothetical protein
MATRGDWWYDERLRPVRDRGLAISGKLHMAELNLAQATKYADGPVDEDDADDLILEIAQWHEALAANGREHVALRQQVRAEYASKGAVAGAVGLEPTSTD